MPALRANSLKTEEKIRSCAHISDEVQALESMMLTTEPTSAPTGSVSDRVRRMLTNVRETDSLERR
jgi:hypothetical protein